MKFALAMTLFMSMSAFANDSFDCRSGQSPQGGKFCYYVLSQCEMADAAEAAECAIKTYANNVTWNQVRSLRPILMDVSRGNETLVTFRVKSEKGQQTQIVTLEVKENEDGSVSHNPVAIEIK